MNSSSLRAHNMGASHSLRLFVVEDQELFRCMLVNVCTKEWGYKVVGEAGTVADAIKLAPKAAPDLLLLDLQLPDGDGFQIAEALFRVLPQLRVLALTSMQNEVTIHRLRELGIQGFVDKTGQTPALLHDAIRAVAAGRHFYTEIVHKVQKKMRDDPVSFPKVLSPREQEALALIGQGFSNDEAGVQLGVTPWTIHTHRRNIMRKLGLNSESELMRYAMKKGFVRPPETD